MALKPDLDTLLKTLVEKKGSDLHLQADYPPVFRVHGHLVVSDGDKVTSEDIEGAVCGIMQSEQVDAFQRTKHIDYSYSIKGVGRFRVNTFRQRGKVGSVMRCIPEEIASIEALSLPAVVKDFASRPNGLVLVTGPTGSGKSTTLARVYP